VVSLRWEHTHLGDRSLDYYVAANEVASLLGSDDDLLAAPSRSGAENYYSSHEEHSPKG